MYLCTFGDIDYEFRTARDIGLPISLAVFEPGHLRAGLAYIKNGFTPPGSMIKFFFESAPIGVAARGLPPTRSALGAYLDMLDGFDLPWMAAVTGAPSLDPAFSRLVLEAGGHLSVGIERTGRAARPATSTSSPRPRSSAATAAARRWRRPKPARPWACAPPSAFYPRAR